MYQKNPAKVELLDGLNDEKKDYFILYMKAWLHLKRYRNNQMIIGGETIMKKKEKKSGILFWNEEEERLSMLYINKKGFLEMFQPLNKHIKDNFV